MRRKSAIPMHRKLAILLAVCLLLGLLPLSACAPKTQLTVASSFSLGEAPEAAAAFEKENRVEIVWTTASEKDLAGAQADILLFSLAMDDTAQPGSSLGEWASAGALEPLNGYADFQALRKGFLDGVLNASTLGGSVLAVPISSVQVPYLLADEGALAGRGIPLPDENWTWQDAYALMQQGVTFALRSGEGNTPPQWADFIVSTVDFSLMRVDATEEQAVAILAAWQAGIDGGAIVSVSDSADFALAYGPIDNGETRTPVPMPSFGDGQDALAARAADFAAVSANSEHKELAVRLLCALLARDGNVSGKNGQLWYPMLYGAELADYASEAGSPYGMAFAQDWYDVYRLSLGRVACYPLDNSLSVKFDSLFRRFLGGKIDVQGTLYYMVNLYEGMLS